MAWTKKGNIRGPQGATGPSGLATTTVVSDWNNATTPGFYYAPTLTSNCPASSYQNAFYGQVQYGTDTTEIIQTLYSDVSTTESTLGATVWTRVYTNSAWSAWQQLSRSATGGAETDWITWSYPINYTSNSVSFAYKRRDGLVFMRGDFKNASGATLAASSNITLATLPAGFRPGSTIRAFVGTNSGAGAMFTAGSSGACSLVIGPTAVNYVVLTGLGPWIAEA